jgi:hypothetical protein
VMDDVKVVRDYKVYPRSDSHAYKPAGAEAEVLRRLHRARSKRRPRSR